VCSLSGGLLVHIDNDGCANDNVGCVNNSSNGCANNSSNGYANGNNSTGVSVNSHTPQATADGRGCTDSNNSNTDGCADSNNSNTDGCADDNSGPRQKTFLLPELQLCNADLRKPVRVKF